MSAEDPSDAPVIDPNFLAELGDMDLTIDSVRIGQEIMSQPAIARYVQDEFQPGPSVRTRSQYERYICERACSGYHPVGTCKMGQDAMAVVGPSLRVLGIDGLRVAHASIMPRLTSGNTNAPSIMIGERAADLIRGNRIPSAELPVNDAA